MTLPDEDDAAKLLPLVWRDLAAPAAQAIGGTLGNAVRAALSPANIVFLSVERALDIARDRVFQRLELWRTPAEAVRTPPPEVADTVILRLRNPSQNETLRDQYVTLLARAMDARYPEWAHPAFVDVLGQLTPLEASVLPSIQPHEEGLCLVEVQRQSEVSGWITIAKHLNLWISDASGVRSQLPRHAVDNLVRLGILTLHTDLQLMNDPMYGAIKESPACQAAVAIAIEGGGIHHYRDYIAAITAFGSRFMAAIDSSHIPGAA